MSDKIRVVHYVNQMFAQVGGEEQVGVGPGIQEGPVGPGRALQQILGDSAQIVATVYCGDNYFAEHQQEAIEELIRIISSLNAELLVAGPAFLSGRYGVACGALAQAVQDRLEIPVVAGMDEDNVGADLYRKAVYIVNSGTSVARMSDVLQRMAALGQKLVRGEKIGKPADEGHLPRGVKRNEFAEKPPAERAVDMLLAKLQGKPIVSEITAPKFQRCEPAEPVRDMGTALIALVTDGGLVPEGNPERMEPGRPTRFTALPINGIDSLDAKEYDVYHSGFDTTYVNQDPHRLVPLDIMRDLEKQKVFGKLHEEIHATGGAHAEVDSAISIGKGIAERLKSAGVNGVVLTST
jgi:betaine reductase